MANARNTEERLRNWLDSDQASRERLCVQVLSLDRRFSNVRPRQPKGGPDGGYDLEAVFEDGRRVVGAIGFRNSASDNVSDQRWARKKFQADLASAKAGAGEFGVFVFFTNVRFTVGAKQRLVELAKASGSFRTEIVDRENMRIALDSPEGLAARFQYLEIPLTEAEQASFFSRWGADLQGLVTRSFAAVEDRLRRLEFMHEREQPLERIGFTLVLRESVAIADLPHVRACVSFAKFTRSKQRNWWHVGVCDNATNARPSCGHGPCLASAFWLGGPKNIQSSAATSRDDPFKTVAASGGFTEYHDPRIVATLGDIDNSFFALFMNRSLYDRLERVSLSANAYLLWNAQSEELEATPPNIPVHTPWVFTKAELADPWVRVTPKGFTGSLHFSETTPRRLWEAPGLDQPK